MKRVWAGGNESFFDAVSGINDLIMTKWRWWWGVVLVVVYLELNAQRTRVLVQERVTRIGILYVVGLGNGKPGG